ncbi:MAG: YbjN domain-containing protein [Alphaproteobacteria bacterium]|nr:YbjN domain-containing protein [Alphaproteobacteria bacterium]
MSLSLVLPVALLLSGPALARKDRREIIDRIDPNMVADILRERGATVRQGLDAVGDPMLAVDGAYNTVVLFYGCEEGSCEVVQFRTWWDGDHKVTPGDALERMRTTRLGRCYLDGDGDVLLDYEVMAVGGITQDHLRAAYSAYYEHVQDFDRRVVGKE